MTNGGVTSEHIGDIYNIEAPDMEAKLGFTITGHSVVNVAGTKALRIEFLGRMANPQMRYIQVYLIHRGSVVILRTSQPELPASTVEANMIIGGLRLH